MADWPEEIWHSLFGVIHTPWATDTPRSDARPNALVSLAAGHGWPGPTPGPAVLAGGRPAFRPAASPAASPGPASYGAGHIAEPFHRSQSRHPAPRGGRRGAAGTSQADPGTQARRSGDLARPGPCSSSTSPSGTGARRGGDRRSG
jgi:hypothetical protein